MAIVLNEELCKKEEELHVRRMELVNEIMEQKLRYWRLKNQLILHLHPEIKDKGGQR